MKYHTTLSTIIISLLVLLCFALTALWCVFSLGIGSPGKMIVDSLLSGIDSPGPLGFSFASIDRALSDRVRLNDVIVTWEGESVLAADAVTVRENPLSLVISLISGSGSIEVDVEGLSISPSSLISSTGGASQSSSGMDSQAVFDIIRGLEGHGEALSAYPFYGIAWQLNMDGFSLDLGGGLVLEDLRLALSLSPGLELDSFAFSAPSLSLAIGTGQAEADGLALRIDRDGEGYHIGVSLDALALSAEQASLSARRLALSLDFPSLSSLELSHLPIVFSTGAIQTTTSGLTAGLDRLSLSCDRTGADLVILGFSISNGQMTLSPGRLDARLDLIGDQAGVRVRGSDEMVVDIMPQGLTLTLGRPTLDLSWDGNLTASFTSSAQVEGLANFTSSIFSSASSDSLRASLRADGDGNVEAHLEAVLLAGSDIALWDGTRLNVSASASLSDWTALDELRIDTADLRLPMLPQDLRLSARWDGSQLTGQARYGNELTAALDGSRARLSISSLRLDQFDPFIDLYAPVLEAYIDTGTLANGSFTSLYSLEDGLSGSLEGSLALSGIVFNENRFNVASSISAAYDRHEIAIDLFSFTTQWVRLSYVGSISLDNFMPQGSLELELTDSGAPLFAIDFTLEGENEYWLDARIPYFSSSYLRGAVNWAREGVISSNGELRSGSIVYPFDLSLDFTNSRFDLVSSGLVISIDFSQNLNLNISFSSFELPSLASGLESSTIDGVFDLDFDFAAQSYHGQSSEITISSLNLLASRPSLGFTIDLSNDGLRLDDITLADSASTLIGSLFYNDRRLAFTLGDDVERANLSLILRSGDYSGTLSLDELSLDRFGLAGGVLSASLIGRGTGQADFSFSGLVNLTGHRDGVETFRADADVIIDNEGLSADRISYSTENFSLVSDSLSYNYAEGLFSLSASMSYQKVNVDRVYPVSADADIAVSFTPFDSVVGLVQGILSDPASLILSGSLGINQLTVDGSQRLSGRSILFSYDDLLLRLDGDFIQGWADLSSLECELTILDNPVVYGSVSGHFDPQDLDLHLDDIHYDLSVMNWLYPVPYVTFDEPAWVYGDFVLYGSVEESHLYGQGGSHGFDMRVWWVKDAYLHIGDTIATVVDNHASTSMTSVVVVDEDDGELHRGFAVAQAMLSNDNILEWYDVQVWVPQGEEIIIFAPVASQGIQIKGDVSGTFTLHGDLDIVELSGDLDLYNAVFSIGTDELPEWMTGKGGRVQYDNNYTVRLHENCSFVMPLGPNPILQAYFEEGNNFNFSYNSGSKEVDFNGILSFRSGEIYYFQKNFLITEGSIVVPGGGNALDTMRLNLRARLRDYTADGERVDIYLVLNNSSLSNISPTFESIPQLTQEEIMSILGSSILPSMAYGETSLGSIASLLTGGVDVLNRAGIINTSSYTDVSDVVRQSLGLDMFSMRTSMVENFILDAIFMNPSYTFSPIATYLNNTSMYFGKYIGSDFYLQAMISLEAIEAAYNPNPFLASDLSLDFELSLEWENPLGTITLFTNPSNLTPHSIMDNIGISYTRTWRF